MRRTDVAAGRQAPGERPEADREDAEPREDAQAGDEAEARDGAESRGAAESRGDGAEDPPTPVERRPLPGRLVYLVCLGTAGIWLLLDQATKVLAVELLAPRSPVDAGVGGWLEWNLVRNPDAAFGIPGFPGMFILVTIVVLALIVRTLPRTDRLALGFAYGLVAGGALGNMMDRVFREPGFPEGAVVDFIKVGWWPTFNVADSGIVIGAILVVGLLLLDEREERRREQALRAHRSVRPDTTGLPRAEE